MAQFASPSRVPFGMLDESRLSRLTSTKNKQNALASPSSILSKRKATADPFASDFDSENVDPSLLSPKKSKLSSGHALKQSLGSLTSKPSHFILKTDNTSSLLSQAPSVSTRQLATPRRPNVKTTSLDMAPRTAPAGRSPRRRKATAAGLGEKRRTSAPFARINPPTFSLKNERSSGLPFSIDAALSGSVPSYKSAAPAASKWESKVDNLNAPASRSSWFFEIHEDTPDEELGNLMEFSTQTLDISDGETRDDKRRRDLEERGKENIPPEPSGVEVMASTITTSRAVSRKDIMSDEPRTPLGELEAKEFYAEGCDADSVIIVPAEGDEVSKSNDAVDGVAANVQAQALATTATSSSEPESVAQVENQTSPDEAKSNQDAWKELLAKVDEQQKAIKVVEELPQQTAAAMPSSVLSSSSLYPTIEPDRVPLPASEDDIWAVEATSREEAPLFDIWESESAKEEAEEYEALAP